MYRIGGIFREKVPKVLSLGRAFLCLSITTKKKALSPQAPHLASGKRECVSSPPRMTLVAGPGHDEEHCFVYREVKVEKTVFRSNE